MTKTVIFIGYSFNDEDFQQIYSFVKKQMQGLSRQPYIVTLDKNSLSKFQRYNLIPINTDGTYFISKLKEYSVQKRVTLPDKVYDYASLMRGMVVCAHELLHKEYNCVKNPETIYCAFYQDGLIHAYERILTLRKTGKYSCACEFINTITAYKKLLSEYRHFKRYGDVAYIEGYLRAHMDLWLAFHKPKAKLKLPLFYAIGCPMDFIHFKDYKKHIGKIPKFHTTAYTLAKKIVANSNKGGEFVFHHAAWL